MADPFDEALDRCLRLLARKDRFESELRQRLATVPEDVQDRVIAHLKKRRMVDDGRAAEEYARSRSGRRTLSSSALAAELERRGAPSGVVDSVNTRPDQEAATALLESTFSRSPANRARAGRTLARRGFEAEEIESALTRFFGPPEES